MVLGILIAIEKFRTIIVAEEQWYGPHQGFHNCFPVLDGAQVQNRVKKHLHFVIDWWNGMTATGKKESGFQGRSHMIDLGLLKRRFRILAQSNSVTFRFFSARPV